MSNKRHCCFVDENDKDCPKDAVHGIYDEPPTQDGNTDSCEEHLSLMMSDGPKLVTWIKDE